MKFEDLFTIIKDRKKNLPENSYVASLFKKGKNAILQKIGEEATELIIAANPSTGSGREEIIWETADLLFHIFVLLSYTNLSLDDIEKELDRRNKVARQSMQN